MGEWTGRAKRIVVIGNGGGGKTTLARAIASATGLPCHEVDQIQFLPGWKRASTDAVAQQLEQIIAAESWIIDGFGPWQTIESRFERADTIVFVDHPLWVHFWWAAERQIAAARGEQRAGGPEGCSLEDATREVFQAIGYVNEDLRPKLLDLIAQHRGRCETIEINSPEDLDGLLQKIAESGSGHA